MTVKLVGGNIRVHGRRYNPLNAALLRNPLTDLGRGYVITGVINQHEGKTLVKPQLFGLRIIAEAIGDSNREQLLKCPGKARSSGHDNMRQFEQFLITVPLVDFAKRIETHDKEKFVVRILPAQLHQGVNRKAGTTALAFHITSNKFRMIGHCRRNHAKALGKGNICRNLLMGWLPGRDEPDLIELTALAHLVGDVQMAVMDRVKRPSEQTNAHG